MPYRFWLKLAAVVIAVALCVAVIHAWRADRRDRAQLAAELAATKQLLVAADARQHDRDAQLVQTLSALAAEKRVFITPAQIVRDLPNQIPLPAPITLQADQASPLKPPQSPANGTTVPASKFAGASFREQPVAQGDSPAGFPSAPQQGNEAPARAAVIPAADLKPLYDFALDCKACQARLSAAQNDLADERQKTAALTKQRDDALRAVKGGSAWRRVTRAAKWFVIGAAAGALAAKSAH